jgi:hypothetical protein
VVTSSLKSMPKQRFRCGEIWGASVHGGKRKMV